MASFRKARSVMMATSEKVMAAIFSVRRSRSTVRTEKSAIKESVPMASLVQRLSAVTATCSPLSVKSVMTVTISMTMTAAMHAGGYRLRNVETVFFRKNSNCAITALQILTSRMQSAA
jgi:hypothetical protein